MQCKLLLLIYVINSVMLCDALLSLFALFAFFPTAFAPASSHSQSSKAVTTKIIFSLPLSDVTGFGCTMNGGKSQGIGVDRHRAVQNV
jgi:hypothetical protein